MPQTISFETGLRHFFRIILLYGLPGVSPMPAPRLTVSRAFPALRGVCAPCAAGGCDLFSSPFKTLKISSVIIVPPRFPEGNAHPRLRGLLSAGAEEHFLLILWYKKTTPGISSFRSPIASFQVDVRQSGLPEIRNMFIRPHAKSSWVVG